MDCRYTEDMELEDAIHTAILTLKEGYGVMDKATVFGFGCWLLFYSLPMPFSALKGKFQVTTLRLELWTGWETSGEKFVYQLVWMIPQKKR